MVLTAPLCNTPHKRDRLRKNVWLTNWSGWCPRFWWEGYKFEPRDLSAGRHTQVTLVNVERLWRHWLRRKFQRYLVGFINRSKFPRHTKDVKNGTCCYFVLRQAIRVKVGGMPWPWKGAAQTLYSGSLWQRRYNSESWLSTLSTGVSAHCPPWAFKY